MKRMLRESYNSLGFLSLACSFAVLHSFPHTPIVVEGTCDSMLWSVSVSEEVILVAELSALPLFCPVSHEAECSRTGLGECILQMQTVHKQT